MRRQDLKHLKYKLINKDGLTPDEASERIKELLKWENNKKKKENH